MSLINQMLRDLEGRKPEAQAGRAEISAAPQRRSGRHRVLGLLALVLALGLATGIGLWFGHRLSAPEQSAPPPGVASVPDKTPRASKAHTAAAGARTAPATAPATEGTRLAAIQLVHADGRSGLDLRFSDAVRFTLARAADGTGWELDLAGVSGVPANLAAAALPPLVRSMRREPSAGGIKLVFVTDGAVEAQAVAPSGREIRLWFGNLAPKTASAAAPAKAVAKAQIPATTEPPAPAQRVASEAPEMVKVPRKPTPQQQAEQDYQDAVAATRAGELGTAISTLKHALNTVAIYAPARELLAQIYLHQGRKADAEGLLKSGLALGGEASDRARLADLYARMLADDGKLDEAIGVLADVKPPVRSAPDHYALLAALEQRAQNYQGAAEIYQRLVEIEPGSGVWWMGLGISLEHLKQYKQAVMAYRRAASSGSLEPAVQKFVDGRIAALAQ